MQITITIDTGNAAFGDGTLEEARPEIIRVLGKIANYMGVKGLSCPDEYPVLDSNGNTCGKVQLVKSS